ncbi:MAG: NAD(P)/FAD-dependent oxidoreductase, partial [Lachnospiraceae bacterium]|nr:NAD(P)/FAD-dependent oxidoreductase [Lachnospiraceae bacterium]
MGKRIFIIGAGAAGMTAAISAARLGAEATILEAQERPGRKLLVTGNGRCNLTSASDNLAGQYHGTGAKLAACLVKEFGREATLTFFSGLGLLTMERNGCIYPCTSQASSVLEVLLAALRRLRVKLKFSEKITEIAEQSSSNKNTVDTGSARYQIHTPSWTYQ